MDKSQNSKSEDFGGLSSLSTLAVDECRNDCNGHSSPDSGVNDLSYERSSTVSNVSTDLTPLAADAVEKSKRVEHVITVGVDERITMHMGDTTRIVSGPANITMVANNGPSGPLPIHAPHGHMVQSVMDENGMVTQYVLRPQLPNISMNQGHGGQMPQPVFPYNASNSQGMSMPGSGHHQQYGYNGQRGSQSNQQGYPQSSQQPYPAGYHPQYHHHVMAHPIIGDGPNNNNHTPGSEDRIQLRQNRHREKTGHTHRHKTPDILMQPGYNQNINPRMKMNGGSPRGGERSQDLNSCSSSTDSHDTAEDEKRLLFDGLSAIHPPQVEVESRRAVVCIIAPSIPDNLISLDHPVNSDVHFQLQYTDKKDGPYTTVYEGDATTIKMQDLRPATEYFVRLCAILDDVKGNFTEPVMFETRPAPPDTPSPPRLCSKGKAFVAVKWGAVADNGSKVLHYILEYYQGQQKAYMECFRGLKKDFKLVKLQPSQRYTFRLAAVNECGTSEYSKEMTIFTNGTAPGQPDAPRLSEATLNSLLLTWIKRPGVDKEFVLQKEEEHTGHGFMAAYTGPEVSYRVDCLRKSTTYKFRLQAANDDGKSVWSPVVTYRTSADLPSAPVRLSVKGKVLGNTFKLLWEAPREDGGSQVKSYLAQLDGGKGFQPVYEGTACECSCSNLLPGHTYKARVAARNSIGMGHWSEPAHVTTKVMHPGQCVKLTLVGKPKAHTLHLKWVCPEYTGGATIKYYLAQLIMMDNTTREVYRGHGTECTVAGLSPGRSYLLQVKAANEAGEGEWSPPLEVISGAGNPEPPHAPVCYSKSAHSILVRWNTPCNNGAKISEYRLDCLQPHQENFTCVYTGKELEHEVKSLQPNTEYSFRAQALNSSGPSQYSEVTVLTTLPSSPAAVHHIRATASATSVTVSWSEPNNNGSEIIQYNVEYGKNQVLAVTDAGETECTVENLDPDTLYRIRVQAVNTIGAGVYSSQIKVTTSSLPPLAPCLECTGSTWNSVRLRWSEVDRCDQYTVLMYRNQSATPLLVYQGLLQQCRVTKLHEHTSYQFTISAENSAGEGPESEPLTVTTCRAPPHSLKAPVIDKVGENECEVTWLAAKPFASDSIEYRLQLSQQGHSSSDYKQIVQTSSTRHHLSALAPGVSYSVRVCPVRLCADEMEPIAGAYSPGTSFRTHKRQPIASSVKAVDSQPRQSVLKGMLERTFNRLRPEKENQFPIIMLLLLFVCSILIAFLVHYFMG